MYRHERTRTEINPLDINIQKRGGTTVKQSVDVQIFVERGVGCINNLNSNSYFFIRARSLFEAGTKKKKKWPKRMQL